MNPDTVAPRRWPRLARWLPAFVGAVAVRVAYWIVVLPGYVPMADADQYRRLGQSIASGHGFQLVFPQMELHPTAFRPPLYPALLAPGLAIFGRSSLWPARLLSVLLGSLVVVLAGVLAARVAGRVAGLAAAAVVAVYPPLLANDTVVLSEPLALALLLGAILLVDSRRWAWAGVVSGLLLLTRPNGYLVVAVLALWAWRTVGWRRAAGLAGCAGLILMPWLIRNHVQVGTWRPTTSDGFTLAAMYGAPARAAGTFVDPVFSPAYNDVGHRFAQFDEALWNNELTNEGVDGATAHPSYVWRTVRRNFRGYFELSPELNRYPERNDGRRWDIRQTTRPLFFVVTAVGLVGLARRYRDPRVLALAAIVAQFVMLSLLLVAPPRLRAPFDLAMAIGVGLLAADLTRWFTVGDTRTTGPRTG